MQTETVTPMFQVFWSIPVEVNDPTKMNFVLIYMKLWIDLEEVEKNNEEQLNKMKWAQNHKI